MSRQAPKPLPYQITTADKMLVGVLIFLALACVVIVLLQPDAGTQLLALRSIHYWLSRTGLLVALILLVASVYIGLARHSDVTPLFRSTTYAIVGFMLIESLVGLAMYVLIGARPYDPVHIIYGLGAVLSLPFFIYVETTAKKRPAMGSYIWGFTILAAIIVRLYMTGAAG